MRIFNGPELFIVGAIAAAIFIPASAVSGEGESGDAPVTSIKSVDLARYAGLWHEIAKIPNRFQDQCVRNTTAMYTLRDDGKITVLNSCIEDDGKLDTAEGIARIEDSPDNGGRSRLKVSFVSFLGWRPFWGDYWIIGLDQEYRWAVVGTPNRKYGWVLARTPTLDEAAMNEVFAVLQANGYEWDAFEMSRP